MIANPFLTAPLPFCQRVGILLMLACSWERYGRLDINQEIVVVSAFMSVSVWELSLPSDMTPFQPLSGSSRTVLDVFEPQADDTKSI